ncbi:MAG: hypothetical protein ACRCUM_03145 [Mycoplasmoidaceae bacterium]
MNKINEFLKHIETEKFKEFLETTQDDYYNYEIWDAAQDYFNEVFKKEDLKDVINYYIENNNKEKEMRTLQTKAITFLLKQAEKIYLEKEFIFDLEDEIELYHFKIKDLENEKASKETLQNEKENFLIWIREIEENHNLKKGTYKRYYDFDTKGFYMRAKKDDVCFTDDYCYKQDNNQKRKTGQ